MTPWPVVLLLFAVSVGSGAAGLALMRREVVRLTRERDTGEALLASRDALLRDLHAWTQSALLARRDASLGSDDPAPYVLPAP